jgi:hypothetical protein
MFRVTTARRTLTVHVVVIIIIIIIIITTTSSSPKGDEVTGDWRKLHNEELHNSHSSPTQYVHPCSLGTNKAEGRLRC